MGELRRPFGHTRPVGVPEVPRRQPPRPPGDRVRLRVHVRGPEGPSQDTVGECPRRERPRRPTRRVCGPFRNLSLTSKGV